MNQKSIISAAIVILAGCGSTNHSVSLSARAGSSQGQALSVAGGVEINRLRMVIKEIKLTPADSISDAGADDRELARGPYLIDLSGTQLGGTVNQVFDIKAPRGTYKQIKFRLHKVEDVDTSDPRFAPLKDKSVVIDGTYAGSSFTFVSSVDEEQEREGTFKLGAGGENITMTFDMSQWFVDSLGQTLDPNNSDNRSKIESNIKASIDVFEDDDHRGVRH